MSHTLMCLGVPGKIIRIEQDTAIVDYDIEQRSGKIIDGMYTPGDYVLVQGGFVVMKVPESEAKQALALYKKAVQHPTA